MYGHCNRVVIEEGGGRALCFDSRNDSKYSVEHFICIYIWVMSSQVTFSWSSDYKATNLNFMFLIPGRFSYAAR